MKSWILSTLLLFPFWLSVSIASGENTNDFVDQIEQQLGVSLPKDAIVEHAEPYVGVPYHIGAPTNLTHEWFGVFTMSPTNTQVFKHELIARNPPWSEINSNNSILNGSLVCRRDQRNPNMVITVFLGPHVIPKSVLPWWNAEVEIEPNKNSPVTTTFLVWKIKSNRSFGGGTVLIAEKTGKIWIWTCQIPQPRD